MGFLYQRSTSTKPFESTTSSHTSVFPSSKFYAVPCLESSDSLTHKTFQQAALDNEKVSTSRSYQSVSTDQRSSSGPVASLTKKNIMIYFHFFPKALVRNPAVLQRISEVPECYGNDNDLDFSVIKVQNKLGCNVSSYA